MSDPVNSVSSFHWRNHAVALSVVVLMVLLGLRGVQKTIGDTVIVEQPHASLSVGPLVDGIQVGQTFFVEYQGLSTVEVRFTPADPPRSSALIFHLQSSGERLLTQTVTLESMGDDGYYAFEFPPLSGRAKRRAAFYLEPIGVDEDDAIAIWGTREDKYEEGRAVLTPPLETSEVQDLAFRLTYRPSLLEKIQIFASRLVEAKPFFWGDIRLYGIVGGLYLVAIYMLIVGLLSISHQSDG